MLSGCLEVCNICLCEPPRWEKRVQHVTVSRLVGQFHERIPVLWSRETASNVTVTVHVNGVTDDDVRELL